jgi:hypothetical protein
MPALPPFAAGAPFVPRDMLAACEAILTPSQSATCGGVTTHVRTVVALDGKVLADQWDEFPAGQSGPPRRVA